MKNLIFCIVYILFINSCEEPNSYSQFSVEEKVEHFEAAYIDSITTKISAQPTDTTWKVLANLHHTSTLDTKSGEIVSKYFYTTEHEKLDGRAIELAGFIQRFGNGIHLTRYDCVFKFCGVGEDDSKKNCLPEEMVFLKGFEMPIDSSRSYRLKGVFSLNKEYNRQFCYILENVEVVE